MEIGDEVLVKGKIVKFDASDNTVAVKASYRCSFWVHPEDITVTAQQPATDTKWHKAAQLPDLFMPVRMKLANGKVVIGCHGHIFYARADKGYIPTGKIMSSTNGFEDRAGETLDVSEWQYITPGEYQTTPPDNINNVRCLLKSGKERLGWFECREPGVYPAGWHLLSKESDSTWEPDASTKVIAWREI